MKKFIEEELKKRTQQELDMFKSVIDHFSSWQKSIDLRNHIIQVETNVIENDKMTDELKNSLTWIKDKVLV